jgi:hypothetical protein
MGSELDMPHSSEATPNANTENEKTLTAPKRDDNQPVSGTVMASATA